MPVRTVFADTCYWVGITNPKDQWHEIATAARRALGDVRMLTTEEVLVEYLNSMSVFGAHLRGKTAEVVRAIQRDPNTRVLQQSRDTFLKGLERYEKRADKLCGLTDCISMNAMDEANVRDVLTHDAHFAQEGYNVLMGKGAGSAGGN